ncbi:hypothetical protein V6N13_083181 [Hibiscus sabdariffa]
MDPTLRCRGQKGEGVRSGSEKTGVLGVTQPECLDLLARCAIGWFRFPIPNQVDLKVLNVVFPVRVSEAELFLRGPRVSRVVQGNRSDGSKCDSEDMMANSAASDVGNGSGQDRMVGECQGESGGAIHVADAGETGQVLWWGNQLWDTVGEGVESDAQVTKKEVVSDLPGSDGLNLEFGGPVVPYKGTAADVIMYRGSCRKVQLLNDVIRSVQSPAEVLANAKRKGKGHGRPRKEGEVSVRLIAPNSPSVIADISITDSNVNCRQSAILREAKATVGLGKLIGATTIGNEEVIIQDIARLLLPSS